MNADRVVLGDSATIPADVAYASLFDLARLRAGAETAEICEACNTINIGFARFCKGCSHKLPAFYAAMRPDDGEPPARKLPALPEPARTWELAVFWLVVNSLSFIAATSPAA